MGGLVLQGGELFLQVLDLGLELLVALLLSAFQGVYFILQALIILRSHTAGQDNAQAGGKNASKHRSPRCGSMKTFSINLANIPGRFGSKLLWIQKGLPMVFMLLFRPQKQ
jgi:hypothetical protein